MKSFNFSTKRKVFGAFEFAVVYAKFVRVIPQLLCYYLGDGGWPKAEFFLFSGRWTIEVNAFAPVGNCRYI